jgi:hypothetical protein
MALSWNEIKDRALKFSNDWGEETKERAEKDSFYNEFFHVFGIQRKKVATFEEPVKKLSGNQGFIDLFWKGTLLVEHKSKGKNLDKAFTQALDYFPGIKDYDLPKYIMVSDFDRIKLFDLEEKTEHEFHVSELYKNVSLFGFIAGYQKRTFKEEDPVNIKAAELMGKLYDQLEGFGYKGHHLEVYLVRLLFILFADDTSIFEKDTFKEFLDQKTNEDGSDLGALMAQFFQVLNTPQEKRLKNLDDHLNQFPYVNGKLFEEFLPIASFNSKMRSILLEASALDWGKISPAIFGSLFQSVMNPEERRNLGAHYTSEKNIFKLIKPLFLDELREEFEKVKSSSKKLKEFHHKLSTLKFLDPACGSGNFLIITYRELRLLEIDILRELFKKGEQVLDISSILWLDVDQFYGIEYDEFASKIAEVAMWLIDHQMNMRVSEEFGQYFARLPLKKAAKIVHADALEIDWNQVISKSELSYIIGNPPFIGSNIMKKEQRNQIAKIFENKSGGGTLDYVVGWYILASKFILNTNIKVAFVSTNSIVQGEQTSLLWGLLQEKYGVIIHFAHRTFDWSNEAKGNAGVHCVIIGFANFNTSKKIIFDYEDIKGDAQIIEVNNINAYLVDSENVLIQKNRKPICNVPNILKGNYYAKSKGLIVEEKDLPFLLENEPRAKKWIKLLIGASEFINNKKRYCLWLVDCPPNELRSMPLIMERINQVRLDRLKSTDKGMQNLAPTRFRETNNPEKCLVIPVVSSENRKYIPIGFIDKNTISTNSNLIMPNAELYHFGVLMSEMHMSWVKYTCGRLESRLRYSKDVVYNNYPWAKEVSEKNKKKIEEKAQKILDVRAEFPDSSLADLYHQLTMPPKLAKAHLELDKAVDLCYRSQAFTNENARIEYLFDLYNQYTAPLLNEKKLKKKK